MKERENEQAAIRCGSAEETTAEKIRHSVRSATFSPEAAAAGNANTAAAIPVLIGPGSDFSVSAYPDEPAAAGDAPAPMLPDRAALPDARRQRVFNFLDAHAIRYTWYTHPEAPTCEIALRYCLGNGARHCKNLFLRNHKGDRHYLVCFDATQRLAIRDLEQRLRQGKLSFASPERLERWLGLQPGSVSPFGLINDREQHVHLFLDSRMRNWERFAFHPNDNRATVLVDHDGFFRFLSAVGNTCEFVELY